jgi:hypothetical protein
LTESLSASLYDRGTATNEPVYAYDNARAAQGERLRTLGWLADLVTAYDEGVLPVDERTRFDEHLTECPDCVEYLAQFRRTVAAIGLAAPELERTPPITDLLRVFRDWKRGLNGGVAGSC